MKTGSKYNRKNPTNINALKLKNVQIELAHIYLKEQIEYIQNQINKIRDLVEDRIAWQMVKMKWAEGRALWKLNWKLPAKKNKYTCGNNILRIFSENLWNLHMSQSQELDIKLGQCTQELDSVLRKIRTRKAAGLD